MCSLFSSLRHGSPLQALPPPAECKVQGFTIEELEPQMNFRRPWTLGYDPKIEGKMHVLPYMRGNQDISLRSRCGVD